MSKDYPLDTGELDRQRLEILHRLYSPITTQFLIEQGLTKGMTVLEFGCGMGDMACWFAEYVGDSGKVVAIDSSQDSLNIAREKAKHRNIQNIEFICLDVKDIASLNMKFDFIYGKWVLVFSPEPQLMLEKLYSVLKDGGILSYETNESAHGGSFSYPELEVVTQWFDMSYRFFSSTGRETRLGAKLHSFFSSLNLKNIHLRTNQPILITEEEKSVFRLGVQVGRQNWLKLISEAECEDILSKLILMEKSDSIVGFYRNIIAIGKK
jgi:ubiquinone/menaquinone biosynthesis C-methylase UbiE